MHYKPTILPAAMGHWKRVDGATLTAQTLVLPKGSSATYQVLADSEAIEQAVSARYRLEVTYAVEGPKNYSATDAFLHVTVRRGEDYPDTNVSVQIQPRLGETKKIIRYFEASGGTMEALEFKLHNISSETPLEISKVELFPSYDLDDSTLEEVDKLIPAIQHVENTKTIRVHREKTFLVDADIEAAADTNLLMHFLLNFKYVPAKVNTSEGDNTTGTTDEVTLVFNLDEGELSYSPLTYSLIPGYNLISLPLNIMNVAEGMHKFKISISTTGADFYIEQYKMQLTLDGKNLISRSGSSAPSAFVQVHIAQLKKVSGIEIFDTADTKHVEVERLSVSQRIRVPKNAPLGYLGAMVNVARTAVAEQIDFTQGIGSDTSSFVGSKILTADGGVLGLKPSNIKSTKFVYGETFSRGDYFYLDLDNTDVESYRDIRIDPMLVATASEVLPINSENWQSDNEGFFFEKEAINMKTKFTRKLANPDTHGDLGITFAEVLIDTENFTEIQQIQ